MKLSNVESIEGERENLTFSHVTPPVTLDTLDRTVYYYKSLEHVVYKRTLDISSQDENYPSLCLFNLFYSCLLNWSLIFIHLDLGMTRLHKYYTLMAEPLKGKLIYGEYSDYIMTVLQE